MRKFLFLIICTLFLVPCTFSQAPQSWTSAEMYQALRKLNILGSVLYVAAHPDDENTRLIAFLSKDKLYRAGYLSLTRGDGGQNLIGDEQGIELGLIRTQELLAARRVDGGEQFFSRAYDFGYSKTPEETFTKWDREKILSDVVWVIRKFQPDVIITRFSAAPQPGNHGHHVASAILANEAFTAAADPNRFPEQLKYAQPWQAKRILWNTANFGGNNQTNNDQFKFDVGGYNPLLGKSYGEIAATSRSNHKSQGFGSAASRGEALEYFRSTGGTAPATDLMDGVDLSWKRVPAAEFIGTIADSLSSSFDFLHPEKSVKGLVRLYKAINGLPDGYWKIQKLKETQQLIEQCSGLFLDATATEQFAVQTDSVRINFSINNRLGAAISLSKVSTNGFDSAFSKTLLKNQNVNFGKTIYLPATTSLTQPYWLANKMEEGYFNVSDQQKIGQADVDAGFIVNIALNIEGQDFNFAKAVKYKFTDPVKGEIYQPLAVMPLYTVKVKPDMIVNSGNQTAPGYEWLVTSNKVSNNVQLKKETGNSNFYSSVMGKGQVGTFQIPYSSVHPEVKLINGKVQLADFTPYKSDEPIVDGISSKPAVDVSKIQYDHIPIIIYFKNSGIIKSSFNYQVFGKKIGYIVGAGDKVPEALEQMGYEVTLLTDKELARNNLKQFDAILTGVRAYNTNDWMSKYYDKLMKYVNDGGNFIVQYNTPFFRGGQPKFGPYNFSIINRRITDENAAVTFLKPEHPVLNFPNKITQDDFKGWVQERSIYHANAWDSTKFETVLTMNDPGEKPDEGSLIIAKYGKGVFVYTGLVFFRELPAGVPGAYRLMANIIALNRKKAF